MSKSPEQYQPTKEEIKEAEGMMTKKEKEMSKERSEQIEKFIERFGEIKISDELKGQILPHIDNKTLTIANEYLAAVVTERSERGRGIGYWDQVNAFFHDKNKMQEWNWRHKDNQNLDKKYLSVQNIGGIEASKDGDRIIVTMELINNDGKRTVDFEFPADKTKLPFEDGEIPMKIVRPVEAYARKEINDELKYATDLEDIQSMAKANGLELTKDDFHKVVENNLHFGLIEYLKKAQKVAEACGLELSKDDYKEFVFNNLGRYDTNPAEDIKIVNSFAKFQKEDLQEIADYCIKNKIPSYVCFIDDDYGLIIAKKIVEYGKLDKENFYKIAATYIERGIFGEALKMSKTHNFEFTEDEYQKLVGGFLSEAKDGLKNPKFSLKRAQEAAKAGNIEITKDDYKKFLDDCIEEMFRYEDKPAFLKDYPKDKLKQIQEIANIAGIKLEQLEQSLPKWFRDVQEHDLEEAEKMYSFKPEMRSAKSRTGNKPYEKPEITESIVDEIKGYGAFVLKEQIDHDTRFPQMRYTLYFVDKSGNKKAIFEKHDYIDDGGGGSIYAKNDPSITEVQISDKKIEFKVGRKTHKVSI